LVEPIVRGENGYEKEPELASAEQTTFPEESVVNLPPLPNPVQLAVERVRPPEVICTPPEKVDVEVFVILRFVAVVDPKKELILVARMFPPVIVIPLDEARERDEMPPAKVLVAVEVEVMLPTTSWPSVLDAARSPDEKYIGVPVAE